MKKWYEYKHPTGSFYCPTTSGRSQVSYFKTPEELAKFANALDTGFDIRTDSLVEVYNSSLSGMEEIELPIGVYAHEYASPGKPERLEPVVVRNDKYLKLLDSLKDLDDEVEFFLNNKEMYEKSSTIYKLGILLFGPAGTGKSCYIREFIRKHEAIVIYIDEIPTRSFLESINEDTKDILKIFVFEEVVSRLEDSHAIKEMLDFLDGSQTVSNAIYFMSTNYPDTIPENVIRNGRIDVFVRVEYPNEQDRAKIINLYLDREPTTDELKYTDKMPIVDIRHMCFLHKKTNKSFQECAKLVDEKNKMIKKHFGKTKEIGLA